LDWLAFIKELDVAGMSSDETDSDSGVTVPCKPPKFCRIPKMWQGKHVRILLKAIDGQYRELSALGTIPGCQNHSKLDYKQNKT